MNHAPPNWPAPTGHLRRSEWRAARAPLRGRLVYGVVRGRAAFTLAEILIAIALVVIVGGLAVANLVGIASGVDHQPPEKVLLTAIREARFLAMQRMSPTTLTFNNEERTFDILDEKGVALEQMPAHLDEDTTEFTLTFTPIMPLKDVTSDYATAMQDPEFSSQVSPRLVFHPSGVSAPVNVTIKNGPSETKFTLDPFSAGPPPKAPAPGTTPAS